MRSSLLPLWEKVARTKSVPDEGFASADGYPSPAFASRRHPLPQGEGGKRRLPRADALLAPGEMHRAIAAGRMRSDVVGGLGGKRRCCRHRLFQRAVLRRLILRRDVVQ